MQDAFYIYIDRLGDGEIETLEEEVDPSFLEVTDGNLFFPETIAFHGTAYIAETHLILSLNLSTHYQTYCKICNELIVLPFTLNSLYITEEIENIPNKIFDLRETLRDAILLEIPLYSECVGGCSMRNDLNKYLKQDSILTFKEI